MGMGDQMRRWLGLRGAAAPTGDVALLAERLRLPVAEARPVLAAGAWVTVAEDTHLTEEGARPEALMFIVEGEVDVLRLGERVARVGRGNFIGEMALLEADAVASATSVSRSPVRAFCLPYAALPGLEQAAPRVYGALQGAIARDLRLKIVAQNVRNSGI
jgi:CRP-like cAMP-binding protein